MFETFSQPVFHTITSVPKCAVRQIGQYPMPNTRVRRNSRALLGCPLIYDVNRVAACKGGKIVLQNTH